jgi:hypothetical protein
MEPIADPRPGGGPKPHVKEVFGVVAQDGVDGDLAEIIPEDKSADDEEGGHLGSPNLSWRIQSMMM